MKRNEKKNVSRSIHIDIKELDSLLRDLDILIHEIEEYNSTDEEDLYGYGDMLEVRRIALLSKLNRFMTHPDVINGIIDIDLLLRNKSMY